MVDGIALVEHIGWDEFNENQDLITQIQRYKQRYGYYPERVLVDGIYGTRKTGHGERNEEFVLALSRSGDLRK